MKRLLLNIIALYLGITAVFAQGTDSFITQDWSNEIRDPEFITLYIAINSFEDPAPLNNGIWIICVLAIFYLIMIKFLNKDTKK